MKRLILFTTLLISACDPALNIDPALNAEKVAFNNDGSLVACEAKILYKVLGGKSDTVVIVN